MFRFFRWLLGLKRTESATTLNSKSGNEMNESNYHSGPAGYSPNTPYAETQYGSGFDKEADWAEGDH
jgi:hypothetical protein